MSAAHERATDRARCAAVELALAVARAATVCDGAQSNLVIGDVAAGWYASLPVELQTTFAMAGEMVASHRLAV